MLKIIIIDKIPENPFPTIKKGVTVSFEEQRRHNDYNEGQASLLNLEPNKAELDKLGSRYASELRSKRLKGETLSLYDFLKTYVGRENGN